jgi:hypothetical protein
MSNHILNIGPAEEGQIQCTAVDGEGADEEVPGPDQEVPARREDPGGCHPDVPLEVADDYPVSPGSRLTPFLKADT